MRLNQQSQHSGINTGRKYTSLKNHIENFSDISVGEHRGMNLKEGEK
jgi:hypothetical protein